MRFSVNWLTHAIDGIQAFPDAAALTGRIAVAFEPAKPSWLPASLLPYYGLTSFGDERRWLTTTELPVGANTAFRKQVFDTVGPFREDLGRMARSLISCEESEMAMRLHRRQFRIGYVPGAVVQHRVSSNRATLAWLRRRAFWGGVSNVLVERGTLAASRRELMKQSSDIIRKVSKSAFNNGLGVEHQLEYVRQLGIARQLLVEATIQRRS